MAQQPTLTTDEALVLQQINEHGEDDVIGLEQSLPHLQWYHHLHVSPQEQRAYYGQDDDW